MKKSRFDIIPFKGVLPLEFRMNTEQVHNVLGITPTPSNSIINRHSKCLKEYYLEDSKMALDIVCAYEKDTTLLNSVSFGYTTNNLYFQDINIFELSPEIVLNNLIDFDPKAYIDEYGFIVFFEIGISLTGFHDNDESQKAITIYEDMDYWNNSIDELKLLNINHYF